MSWSKGRTAEGIPDRVRSMADPSKVTTVTDAIRHESMKVTMEMVRQLQPMGFGERFDSTVRGLMVIGYNVPIRVMCIGLYPYEQDILPPIATSLAYSPVKCHGCTPSVQIMSQAMAIVAKMLRDRNSKKSSDTSATRDVDDAGLVSKFAMLLRCSYLCSIMGVAFINCVPIPVDNMAKRVRAASIFSEWLGRMIKIHNGYGFKMNIMAMGSFASDSVRSTFSSYKGTNVMVNYVGLSNPAAISYMNIHKYPGMQPIQSMVTDGEMKIDMSLGVSVDLGSYTEYEWKTYPADTLYQYMKIDTIGSLTRALVGHTAEELLEPFSIMSSNLFSNLGGVPAGYTPGPLIDTDDRGSNAPTGMNMGQMENTGVNPSGSIFAQPGQNQQSGMGQGQGGGGYQSTSDKSFYVGKNSILAQMNDTTGKSKSQQVIVLENMISKLENILESFRSRERTVNKIVDMLETIVDRHSVEDDELADIIEVIKERFPEELVQLEEASAVVAAMPALIEGDTGVIEGMLQPSAPLMRRYDGSTMRDGVYEQMLADRGSGVAQARNPPQSLGVFSSNEPMTNTGMFTGSGMPINQQTTMGMSTTTSMDLSGHMTTASETFLEAIEQFGTDEMIDAVQEGLLTTAGGPEMTMMDIMTVAIATYMSASNGSKPDDDALKGMIELMSPTTNDNMTEVGTMIRDLCQDRDELVNFFDDTLTS